MSDNGLEKLIDSLLTKEGFTEKDIILALCQLLQIDSTSIALQVRNNGKRWGLKH